MTLKNNRAPLLSNIKLCASFHHHRWIQTGVTVRNQLSWVLTFMTLTFDLWPWPFAWTSFLSLVITPENFMMIRWWEHSKQERLKRWNTLGCLNQYAAQNSKYVRPPIPSQPPTQKVFFQGHTQYDPTMKHSHCETVYAKELFQWLFFELVHSLWILSILPTFKLAGLTKECQWWT